MNELPPNEKPEVGNEDENKDEGLVEKEGTLREKIALANIRKAGMSSFCRSRAIMLRWTVFFRASWALLATWMKD